MTDTQREALVLQPVPAPWERQRRPRAQRGPDGRLLSEGDRRWMQELAERQAVAADTGRFAASSTSVDAGPGRPSEP